MSYILKLVASLTIICLISAALLAVVYKMTAEPIAQAQTVRETKAAAEVLPEGSQVTKKNGIFIATDSTGKFLGAAIKGHTEIGYAGAIDLMVGIKADGTLINYKILECKETPGLGVKIGFDSFKNQFLNRSTGTVGEWKVKKDGGDIDAVTAATISSRAAIDAIQNAVLQFNALKESL